MDTKFKKYFYIIFFLYISIFILSVLSTNIIDNTHGTISADELRIISINAKPLSSLITLLIRNIFISMLIILSGVLGYEILPLCLLVYNAYDVGQIVAMINKPEAVNMIYALLPHAILEIGVTILVTIFACTFAYKMRSTFGGTINILKSKENINDIFKNYVVKPYLHYILPLIILSCIIESTISLYIMKLIFNG